MTEHTELPWKTVDACHETQMDIQDESGHRIAVVVSDYPTPDPIRMEANAAYIVLSANARDALVEAIETARKHICGNCFPKPKISCAECWHGEFREQYKAALDLAKGE